MSIKDLRTKTESELKESLIKFRKELFNIRFQQANGQLENSSSVSSIKKSIARVKTLLTEKAKNIR